MLLQRLATGATAVKQARYRRGGSEALYAHAQYNTRSLAMHGVLNSAEHFSASALIARERAAHAHFNIVKTDRTSFASSAVEWM